MFGFLRRAHPVYITINMFAAEGEDKSARVNELLTSNNEKLETVRAQKKLIRRLAAAAEANSDLLIEHSIHTGYCGCDLEKETLLAVDEAKALLNGQ